MDLRSKEGRLHVTLSLFVDNSEMVDNFADKWNTKARRSVQSKIKDAFEDSEKFIRALEPLFDDIADRKRHLFVDDFVLDTRSLPGTKNKREDIDFCFPTQITWETEGVSKSAILDRRFERSCTVRCFWFVHSNGSLTYNISFEFGYSHNYVDYYCLSLLQKIFFEKEGTAWILDQKVVRTSSKRVVTFWEYVRENFNADTKALLAQFAINFQEKKVQGQSEPKDLWNLLLVEHKVREHVRAFGTRRATQREIIPERRALFLLEDEHFFELLSEEKRNKLSGLVGIDGLFGRHIEKITKFEVDQINAVELDYYFLAGFFNNIIDFLSQDTSEVKDGTDPVYPEPGSPSSEEYFIVYATKNTIFEIVSSSRSLDVGRDYIGNCPYLFLVHIMALHNEQLTAMFEKDVVELFDKLESSGLGGGMHKNISTQSMLKLLQEFRRFKVKAFSEIHKHLYTNVFRYDTERIFYTSIENIRGTSSRRQYWSEIIEKIEATLHSIKDEGERKSDETMNKLLAAAAAFGLFQVFFQTSDAWRSAFGTSTEAVFPGEIVAERLKDSALPAYMDLTYLSLASACILLGLLFMIILAMRR